MTIPTGQISDVHLINVPVYGDATAEADESLLRQPEQSGRRDHRQEARAIGTILNDNGPADPLRRNPKHRRAMNTVGLYATIVHFHLQDRNQSGPTDIAFPYGPAEAGWIPVAGDWDGNGTDTVGLYNPATSTFYLRNTNLVAGPERPGLCRRGVHFGAAGAGWTPVAGDWNGDGRTPSDCTTRPRPRSTCGTRLVAGPERRAMPT